MKRINHTIYTCFLIYLLSSCSGIDVKHITENYYLTKVDYSTNNQQLSYKLEQYEGGFVGVVEPIVSAIGFNEDFIIVKQHPAPFSETTIDKNITFYYIVPLKKKVHHSPDENKYGPFSHQEYLQKRKELKIPNELTFSKEL